ncbi:MAG: hypothetical protein K6F17_08800 [Lachnospiraceae bacterium]|nr:hypothetical protein [Lachnospiraceae bacterium]
MGDIIGCFAGVTNKIDTKDILPIAIVIIIYLFGFILFCDKCINLIRNNENEKRSMLALVVINILTFSCFAFCVIGVFYFGLHLQIPGMMASATIGVFAILFFYKFWKELMIRMGKITEEDLAEKEKRLEPYLWKFNILLLDADRDGKSLGYVIYHFFLESSNPKVRLAAKIARFIFSALFILLFLIVLIWIGSFCYSCL